MLSVEVTAPFSAQVHVVLLFFYPCDETVFELCCLLMVENEWDVSGDPLGAADLISG